MVTVGIITEYNPFHKGHLYQIQQIKAHYPDANIVVVCSGSFTQRGEPTLLDKWTRAKSAVQSGCDLIFELPAVFACRSAQDFARGGISLLQRLNIVDVLAFGAECTSLTTLQKIANCVDDKNVQTELHKQIAAGNSYATALTIAIEKLIPNNKEILHQPNNILAIEYLRCLAKSHSNITPLLIPRQSANYHDNSLQPSMPSASAIRQALVKPILTFDEKSTLLSAVPGPTATILQSLTYQHIPQLDLLFTTVKTLLLRSNLSELQRIYGFNEGIENRLLKYYACANSWQELVQKTTTKRYPSSRISRLLLYLILQLTTEHIQLFEQTGPLYAHLLAASPQGKQLLKTIKQDATIPLIVKTSQYLTTYKRREGLTALTPLQKMLYFDTLSTELRQLCQQVPDKANDFMQSPYFAPSNTPLSPAEPFQ